MARLHRMWVNVGSASTLHLRASLLICVHLRFPFLFAEVGARARRRRGTLDRGAGRFAKLVNGASHKALDPVDRVWF
jgi:hypothetical protein